MVKSLTIWDIDDTLFRTANKVHVVIGSKKMQSLSAAEFNVYKLKPGEKYDFSEFRSAKHFEKTARPVDNVFRTAKKIMEKLKDSSKKFIIVTARADMDDKKLFLDTFKKYGFDIDRSHIYRAGNIKGGGAEAKKKVIRSQLKGADFNIARMFDDTRTNLDKFLELKTEFPEVNFETFLIRDDGIITRYGKFDDMRPVSGYGR